ncbi:MAG: response regulator [Peptostreptococcaceae bacterium]
MINVLIVEDDPMVAAIDKKYTEDLPQFNIIGICNNGKEAFEILNNQQIDLIILDVYMPKVDGVELLKQMRKNDIKTDVIMVTAAHETNLLKEVLSLGVIDYLVKPFEHDRFTQALNKYVKKYNLINNNSTFNQSHIDEILKGSYKQENKVLKKGLNEKTLDMIRIFMKKNNNKSFTSEEIADGVGLSRVTIRRYMNYMMEIDELNSEIDYETGGRPSIKYKILNK